MAEKLQYKKLIQKWSLSLFYSFIPLLLGFSLILISLILFPEYSIIEYYVSILGIGPAPSAQLFNVGVILMGATAINFFRILGNLLKNNSIDDRIRKIAIRLSLFGNINLTLVGAFPTYENISILHNLFASSFFLSGMIYVALFSYIMFKHPNFPKFNSYFGFLVSLVFASYIFTWQPLAEWLTLFTTLAWIVFTFIHLSFKKIKFYFRSRSINSNI